jgi:hypothetical protein
VALSPLELSVYDEGLQFHAPDDEFGQQYSFHVDVQSNCIQTSEIEPPPRVTVEDKCIETEKILTPKNNNPTPRIDAPHELMSGREATPPKMISARCELQRKIMDFNDVNDN